MSKRHTGSLAAGPFNCVSFQTKKCDAEEVGMGFSGRMVVLVENDDQKGTADLMRCPLFFALVALEKRPKTPSLH